MANKTGSNKPEPVIKLDALENKLKGLDLDHLRSKTGLPVEMHPDKDHTLVDLVMETPKEADQKYRREIVQIQQEAAQDYSDALKAVGVDPTTAASKTVIHQSVVALEERARDGSIAEVTQELKAIGLKPAHPEHLSSLVPIDVPNNAAQGAGAAKRAK